MTRLGAMVRGFNQGFGRGVAGFSGGDAAEQAGYDSAMARETKLAQALAQIRGFDANADRDAALAAETRAKTEALARRPNLYRQQAALSAGVDVPTLDSFMAALEGKPTQVPMGPEAPDGSMGVGSAAFGEQTRGNLAQALQRFLPLAANTGDIKVDDWAAALGNFRTQDLSADVLEGRRAPQQVGAAQAAVAGKPLFNSDANGAVLDLFGGKLATDNPMAGAQINLRTQQANQARAGAAENWAQAEAVRAAAREGTNRAGAKPPTGYRWGSDGQTLEAIPGGPADPLTKGAKLSRPPSEGQAKALTFAARMQLADETLSDLERRGVMRPGTIKGVAETVGNIAGLGTDTFGGALADAAGTLTNWTQSPQQQQVEQAQRDFITAVLRRESGAVIGAGEFRDAAKKYFPQPNDDKRTLAQKAMARRAAIAGMKAEFGEAFSADFERVLRQARGGASSQRDAAPGQPRNVTVDW